VTATREMIDSSSPVSAVQRLVQADGSAGWAEAGGPSRPALDLWLRRCSALLVAGVAAYSSYEHQRWFAAAGGADPASARL